MNTTWITIIWVGPGMLFLCLIHNPIDELSSKYKGLNIDKTRWQLTGNTRSWEHPCSLQSKTCKINPEAKRISSSGKIRWRQARKLYFYSKIILELTRQRRQKRLSKESNAASRSFSRNASSTLTLGSTSTFFTHSSLESRLRKFSNLACIRCLVWFHTSVNASKKWIGNS